MEPLEDRCLLSVGGLGAVGDSLTDEYVDPDQGHPYAMTWFQTQGATGVACGDYRVDPENWGDVREEGWEFNWAQAGATSASLLADGQHTGLAQQVIDGHVTHAVMAIGQNDYVPLGAAYLGIYSGTWTQDDIDTHNEGILANIETALSTLTATDVALVMSNVIDYGVAPTVWGNPALSNVAGRQAVADAISQLNDGVADLAAAFGIPLVDMYGLTKDYLGEHGSEIPSQTVGGVVITNTAGVDGHNAFVADGIHPHTVLQAISANCYAEALNLGYGADLDQLLEVEMLLLAGIFGTGETLLVDYASYVHLPRDFGDAPDAAAGTTIGDYNTRADDGGPSHVIVPGLAMGANLDGELDAAQSPGADGDDTDRATDDEDGLVDPAGDLSLVEGAAPAVEVTVTNATGSAATLYGWIDYNADGVFDNAAERASVAVPDGTNGVVTLDFPAVPQGSAGDTFARFRLSTDAAAADPTGEADDGEVEDYAVSIVALDFGDAYEFWLPGLGWEGYNTSAAHGGPSHVIVPGLFMGDNIDGEPDGFPTIDADGDDNNGTPDDEDGLVDPAGDLVFVVGVAPAVELTVTNTTGSAATLYGWIDYNGDALFDNATERASVAVPNGTDGQVVTLDFPVAPSTEVGSMGARFRLSTDAAAADPTGEADDGEVEDYMAYRYSADFGDAPDAVAGTGPGEYSTRAADGGPSHLTVAGLFMGAGVDEEPEAFPSAGADGDDTDGTPDDEDGLADPAGDLALLVGAAPAVEVTVTNTTGGAATLYGWIDYNADGVFDNATERASVAVPDGTNGVVTLNFPAVPQGSAGDTFARFRLSTDAAAADPTGDADDGEVEDYTVSIDSLDFGDAPDWAAGTGEGDYNTRAADNGPSHLIVPGLRMGANIDGEPDASPHSNALGDDQVATPDDEDGLGDSASLYLPQGSAPEVQVTVTNTTGGAATLYGWIDYNEDGVFDNATERASAPVPDGTDAGVVTLNFPVAPTGPYVYSTFARFRLSTDAAAADPTGEAGDGEVEDYIVQIVPADFGDAPDPYDGVPGEYPTMLPGGAWHGVDPHCYLGDLVDAEPDGQPTALADGDDANGLDDDDGVVLQSAIVPGGQVTLNVYVTNVSMPFAFLQAWIDLDQNGDWLGTDEHFLVNEYLESTLPHHQFQVSVPATASVGPTYVRFRLSTKSDLESGGFGFSGEVEDYLAIVVNEDLGPIGFAERAGLDLSAGDLWYQIETTRAGYVTFQATCDAGAGTVEMTVYDADGAEVDSSATGTGTERVDLQAAGPGEFYFVKLAGTNPDVDLKALNMLSLVGTAAYVMGTNGADSCTYDTDASRLITVNGVEYHFTDPEVDCLLFMGAGGNDSAVFNGSAEDERVRMFPRSRTMPLAPWKYTFATTRVETVTANGGGGDDTVQMYDSPQDDTFSAGPDWAQMEGPGFTLTAYGFRWMHSYSGQGGDDKAELSDLNADPGTPEPVWLCGIPGDSRFYSTGYGFLVRMRGFGQVSAQGHGDDDVANLMDSAGEDNFEAYADWGRMTYEDGTFVEASDYRYLHGFSREGGNDKARVYDEIVAGTKYATTFVGYVNSPILYFGQNAPLVRAWDFEELRVSTDGVDDVAKVYDSPGHSDWLDVPYAGSASYDPADAVFQNANGLIFLDAFEWLKAVTSEDTDTALIDPAYADKVILEGNWIVL
jgi:hypothetical protein